MADATHLKFGGLDDPSSPLPSWLDPNIFLRDSLEASGNTVVPHVNDTIYIWCSVQNTSDIRIEGALVQYWVSPVVTNPSPSQAEFIGSSLLSLDPGEIQEIPCISPWQVPASDLGHHCIVCEITESAEKAPNPTSVQPWTIDDVQTASHNVVVLGPRISGSQRQIFAHFLAVGQYNEAAARVLVRPVPKDLFVPTLRAIGAGKNFNVNITDKTHVGLLSDYDCGDPMPDMDSLKQRLELKHLAPNYQQRLHAVMQVPEKMSKQSAAIFFIEQLDYKGKVIGGLAIIALGGAIPKLNPHSLSGPGIPASIPHRPYSTLSNGFMTTDGFFSTNLGLQTINVETRNDGVAALEDVSMYIEGCSDPNVAFSFSSSSPAGGVANPSPSTFKSKFAADFIKAKPGETAVSFIIQQPNGSSTKKTRIIKKIFVIGVSYDATTKNFTVNIPQGTVVVHIKSIIAPSKIPCGCDGRTIPPYPMLVKSASVNWIPNPPYAGTHGPLPYQDPWWKVVSGIACGIFIIAAILSLCLGGNSSPPPDPESNPGGSGVGSDPTIGAGDGFDYRDPNTTCSNCQTVNVKTTNVVAGSFFVLAFTAGYIAAQKDDADLHDRGQAQTPPEKGELTTSELVNFTINYKDPPSPGTPFRGQIIWDYSRSLDSGRVLNYASPAPEDWGNTHYLKSRTISVDGESHANRLYSHNSQDTLIIGATFTRPNGDLYRGSELYVFAYLRNDTGRERFIELRDSGNSDGVGVSGNYEGGLIRMQDGTWYMLVIAQDVNTVEDGTEPRVAAQTIGGFMLTDQFVFAFGEKPCELNHDAIITVVGKA